MPKIKVPRSNPSLDMTPMVDLAFLLVTFFMLTASFRTEQAVVVDTPSSISEKLLPKNVMMISIDTAGRVYYTIDGQEVRKNILMNMGGKYNVAFTEKEVKEFQLMTDCGMPMAQLKQYLAASKAQRVQMDKASQGIPYDSLKNELADWINYGRHVDAREANNKGEDANRLRFAIKADGKTDYAVVKKVIKVFQDKKVNRFNLITNLEEKP